MSSLPQPVETVTTASIKIPSLDLFTPLGIVRPPTNVMKTSGTTRMHGAQKPGLTAMLSTWMTIAKTQLDCASHLLVQISMMLETWQVWERYRLDSNVLSPWMPLLTSLEFYWTKTIIWELSSMATRLVNGLLLIKVPCLTSLYTMVKLMVLLSSVSYIVAACSLELSWAQRCC